MSSTTTGGKTAKATNVIPLQPEKPNYPEPNFDGIPIELKGLRNWVVWRAERPKPGKTKWRKVPYVPLEYTERKTPAAADTTNSATWRGFDGSSASLPLEREVAAASRRDRLRLRRCGWRGWALLLRR